MTRFRTLTIVATVVTGLVATTDAHFRLNEPASLANQSALGDPQKTEPCGQDDGNPAFVLTNAVTTYPTGSMITIAINETIFHPGHYRVSLAANMSALPADPPVTPVGADACGSTQINPSPTLPLLADGLLQHNASFGSAPQTMQVQLPAGMTCTNCVLQITQYMRNHPAPCFYHHCATVTISDTAPPPTDAGVPGNGGGESGGCSTGIGAGLLAAFGALGLKRKRRR